MSDPFALATKTLFNTSICNSGILTDSDSNQYNVRCLLRNPLQINFPGWDSQIPQRTIEILINKVDLSLEEGITFDAITTITINEIDYTIDGVLQEDDYIITYSVKRSSE